MKIEDAYEARKSPEYKTMEAADLMRLHGTILSGARSMGSTALLYEVAEGLSVLLLSAAQSVEKGGL